MIWFGGVAGLSTMYLSDLRLIGGNGPNTTTLSVRPTIVFIGDSVSIGAQILPDHNSSLSYIPDLGAISNYQVCNLSVGSRSISGNTGSVVSNLSDYSGLSPAPFAMYFLCGVVDILDDLDVTQFGTDYASCLSAFRSDYPNTLIICALIQPDVLMPTAIIPYNAEITSKTIAANDLKMVLSSVIHDIVVTEELIGYHPHIIESREWAIGIMHEMNSHSNKTNTGILICI